MVYNFNIPDIVVRREIFVIVGLDRNQHKES